MASVVSIRARKSAGLLLAGLLLSGLLAACASGTAEPQTGAAYDSSRNVLQVVVNDPRPVRSIQLISPGGEVTAASSITTDRTVDPGYSGSSIGLGIGGASFGRGSGFGGGAGIGLPLGGTRPITRSVTTAIIAPRDPDAYRQDWQRYRIEVLIGDPPQVMTLAAPPP